MAKSLLICLDMLSMDSDKKGRSMKVMIVLMLAQTGERCAENNVRKALIPFKFIPKLVGGSLSSLLGRVGPESWSQNETPEHLKCCGLSLAVRDSSSGSKLESDFILSNCLAPPG